jgi:hypothetical protein
MFDTAIAPIGKDSFFPHSKTISEKVSDRRTPAKSRFREPSGDDPMHRLLTKKTPR